MRQPILLLALVFGSFSAQSEAPATFPYSLSGDQFVQWIGQSQPVSEADYRNRDKAYSYLDGVKDAAAGTAWCPAKPHKTFELAYDAADHIKALPSEDRKGNAARLLLSFLSFRYPCAKGAKQ